MSNAYKIINIPVADLASILHPKKSLSFILCNHSSSSSSFDRRSL
jgi:hypothetical protein